ncbi:MAG: protein phosphatase 2C domain-containing protein [Acidiferrobacterales bacterium]|nr:protein phosphatase 2C domain-containing protein [Acidiferrobacterales bacterium]
MHYSVAQQSNQGGRDYNEDSIAVFDRDDSVLLVVADGLGGHAGGDLASQTLIEAISESFQKATDAQLGNAENFLSLSINYAHHMIHRRAVSRGFSVDSPKSTCVICLVHQGVAQWAHSGDSRLYLIRKRKIVMATEDHVSIKPGKESSNGPINRCVGGLELPRPDIGEPVELQVDDILMLASDGAWHSFVPDDLMEYVDPEHPTLGIDSLLQKLEHRNKAPSDNLSMILLYWGVEQLDKPMVDEFYEENSITLMPSHNEDEDDDDETREKFDMKTLDKTITEIESFISDIDDKL